MSKTSDRELRLFLCGDVMTGRGIDQVFSTSCEPTLHEPFVKDARDYVALAREKNGPIPTPISPSYMWGEALEVISRFDPDVRLINLETAITLSEAWEPKGINYRMHPANVSCLKAAGIDGCTLANNHVLDWGEAGLRETLATLERVGIQTAGAGRTAAEAEAPTIHEVPGGGRVLFFGFGTESSGIPPAWAATRERLGVNFLEDLSETTVDRAARQILRQKRSSDLVIASIHWGGNWGYEISAEERRFAHALIDRAGVDLIHGHSSHHAKSHEVYRDKLILYGCGDLINDYEGISGHEEFGDLRLLYFVRIDPASGVLKGLETPAFRMERFRLVRP